MRIRHAFLGVVLGAMGTALLATSLAGAAVIGNDYPARLKNAPKDSIYPDPWKFYNRECTSFVAWRLNSQNHVAFNDFYRGPQWGNAKNWDNTARSLKGITVNRTPAVGAVAQTDAGWGGHVAWVATVNSNGTVTVEEYNHDRGETGHYGKRTVSRSSFVYIHIKDIKTSSGGKTGAPPPSSGGDSTGYYDPGAAGWHLRNSLSPGSSDYVFSKGPPNKVPVVGDWNGDGKDTVGYYDPGPAGWHLSDSLAPGPSDYIFPKGPPNKVPVVGDWNGDGKDTVGYYDPGPAGWHLSDSLASGPSDYIFSRGKAGVIPVVGNWDGKGGDGVGYYDPSDYSWHLRNSPSAGASDYVFVRGKAGVIPVVGNWDGKGGDGVGYYDPSDYSWHLRNSPSAGASDYVFVRGTAGVVPVVGDWDGR